jgi:hypothetical protein
VLGGVGNQAQALDSSVLGGDAESLNTVYGSKAGPTAFGP